jgi:hypothetical protein
LNHCCPGKSIYNIFTGQPIEDLSFRKKLNLKFYWFLSDWGKYIRLKIVNRRILTGQLTEKDRKVIEGGFLFI